MAALDQRIAQLIALEEEITELQGQIIEHHDNFINDDVISDKTTYSSKKIEEFIDKNDTVVKFLISFPSYVCGIRN